MQINPTSNSSNQAREIGVQVRAARKRLGLRQDELAAAAGVSTRAVHQIENGKPTSRLDTIASVLEVLGLGLEVADRSRVRHAPEADER